MSTHSFTLVLSRKPEFTEEMAAALYGAGCDDALVSTRGNVPWLDFDRDAESFSEAVLSAVKDVESCTVNGQLAGLRVERVEPDDFVNAAEIAQSQCFAGICEAAICRWPRTGRVSNSRL